MFEIWVSNDSHEPHGIEPIATAQTYSQAQDIASNRAGEFTYGTLIVTPNGDLICGDETPAELAALLARSVGGAA